MCRTRFTFYVLQYGQRSRRRPRHHRLRRRSTLRTEVVPECDAATFARFGCRLHTTPLCGRSDVPLLFTLFANAKQTNKAKIVFIVIQSACTRARARQPNVSERVSSVLFFFFIFFFLNYRFARVRNTVFCVAWATATRQAHDTRYQ